jgi:hypothetical protein
MNEPVHDNNPDIIEDHNFGEAASRNLEDVNLSFRSGEAADNQEK